MTVPEETSHLMCWEHTPDCLKRLQLTQWYAESLTLMNFQAEIGK